VALAITSIQRNRAPWLMEWLAFHLLVGFDRFYIYTHKCDDGSTELLQRLARHYPIAVHPFDGDDRPQLVAYQHAWNSYGAQVDWMAFIDGDEFLFPTRAQTMAEALRPYAALALDALAVYWVCYGSSGHLEDPPGLMLEQFTRHSGPEFAANHHVKSIVRGGDRAMDVIGSHVFPTPRGSFDELLRPISHGVMPALTPSYEHFRINHYVTQSHDFFKRTKQTSGAADASAAWVRPDSWFSTHDRNECDDGVRYRFLVALKLQLREMQARLAGG
jgi:Glycosyl transferase family 2